MKQKTLVASVLVLGGLLLLAVCLVSVLLALVLVIETPQTGLDLGSLGGNRVAVVDIEGMIWDVEPWVEQLHDYAERPRVKAIVLNINSPGGGIAPSQELYHAIQQVRKEHEKPVVAAFSSVGASGAYYIACAANEIVASPGGITGSIGVYMSFSNWEGLYDKLGIDFTTIKRGKYKTIGSSDREMTAEEAAMLQHMVDDIYEQFIEVVIDGRANTIRKLHDHRPPAGQTHSMSGITSATATAAVSSSLPPAAATAATVADDTTISEREALARQATTTFDVNQRIRELAEGRLYTGRQAREVGLVDHLGHLDTAIERAARLANIPGEPSILHEEPKPEPGFGLLSALGLSALGQNLQAHTEGTRPFLAYLMPPATH